MLSKIIYRTQIFLSFGLFITFAIPVGQNIGTNILQPVLLIKNAKSSDLTTGLFAPDYSGCGNDIAPLINFDFEQRVVELVNQHRQAIGLAPLKRVSQLDDSARYHATDLGQDNYFDHDTYDRNGASLVYICDTWQRISNYYPGARGENIAAGYASPEAVMDAWMNSSGHRNNILSTASWEIGVGYYQGSGEYNRYWVQNFGRRNGIYPLVINLEAAQTDTQDVSLFIYGDWDQVRLRNNEGNWSDWRPFGNSLPWQLPNQVGQHTVQAEMRSGEDFAASQDEIYLTTSTAVATLGNLPDRLDFYYIQSLNRFSPENISLLPDNIGSDELLEWQATQDGDWFSLSRFSGLTGQILTITPSITTTTGLSYSGMITITVTSHPDLTGSPHPIFLHLQTIPEPLNTTYLPFVNNP